ncbi:hypothetical protein H4Q26_001657 [Puccinia striiformis f. sp. tritici PST-130]|nr:hypothetical protein H4Q26_001657 [Puccinia striiformis f. sp. tritici PST-130]
MDILKGKTPLQMASFNLTRNKSDTHHLFAPTDISLWLISSSVTMNTNQPTPITRSSSGSSTKSHNQPVNLNIPVISTAGPIRSFLLKSLNKEMPILESIQDSLPLRTTRSNNDTFIMARFSSIFYRSFTLDILVRRSSFGRSQVYILGMSVYFTGVLKDLFCIPRPYSPPIQRLSISNHASEYGFPSSHSATSASTFLMGFQYALNLQSIFHQFGLYLGLIPTVFAWSIHQFFGEIVERWATSPQTSVPLILIISGLILTAAYPQPVDDCPCFEDSTAFVAVSVGVMIGHRIANDLILSQIDDPSLSGLRFPQALIKLILGLTPRKHYAPTKDYGRYRDELRSVVDGLD